MSSEIRLRSSVLFDKLLRLQQLADMFKEEVFDICEELPIANALLNGYFPLSSWHCLVGLAEKCKRAGERVGRLRFVTR